MARPRKPGAPRTTRTTRAKAGAKLKSESSAEGPIEDAEVVEDGSKNPVEDTKASVTEDNTEAGPPAESDPPKTEEAVSEAAKEPEAESKVEATDKPEPEAKEAASEETDPGADPGVDKAEPTTGSMDIPQPVAVVPAPPPRRASLVPMVLGGVIAAGLGAGALYYSTTQGWIELGGTDVAPLEAEIDALRSALQSAQTEIEALRVADAAIDGVNEKINSLTSVVDGLSKATVTLGGDLDATNERLAEVATQPIPEARLPEKVTNAYEAKFAEFAAALQKEQDAELAALEARLTKALVDMEAVQSAAVQAEQAAADTARAARVRAALADIEVALDTGTGFAPALDALAETGGPEVPDALGAMSDGSVATLPQLQSGFPDVARAAIVASTRAGAQDGSVTGVTAFFRTQLGARSLEPREGDDPDAVLSRAEEAVRSGELQTALDEIAALPEAGQAALADWKSAAVTRIEAKAALAALSDQLNSN